MPRTRTVGPPACGMACRRTRMGGDGRAPHAARRGSRPGAPPRASRAAHVPPSLPGAPLVAWAIREAARRGARVPRGPDRPQTRQDGAACACASLLRGRACRLRGAGVLSPLPPLRQRHAHQQGPCAPPACPRGTTPPDPSAPRASAGDVPGSPVLRPPWCRRCPGGRRRAAPGAARLLVSLPALPPRQHGPPRQPVGDGPCGRRLAGGRLGLWGCARSGPPGRSLALPPGDAPPAPRWGGREAAGRCCPVPLRSALQGSGFSPGRLLSYCTRQPSLDTHPDMKVSLHPAQAFSRCRPSFW